MAAEMAEAISAAVALAETQAAHHLETNNQQVQKHNNQRISQAKSQSRRAMATLREQLTARLFEDVKTDVIAFTHTPGYENLLIESIQATCAKSKHSFTYVQLPTGTWHLSNKIQEATGLTPEQGEENGIGGYMLLTANRNIAVDNTFKSRLASAAEEFDFIGGSNGKRYNTHN